MTLTEQLVRDEGLRLKPYKDSVGKLTIGVGRNLDDRGLSTSEAMMLLTNDIADCAADVNNALPWARGLDEARRGVLLNMCFNLGIHGLLGFTHMLAALQTGLYAAAAAHMLDSRWAEQVGDRALRLAAQLKTGVVT